MNAKTWFKIAHNLALDSKDQSTKLGCVIVGPSNEIRATGINGFPRKINDHVPERQERPMKYFFMEHAERNAIYNAARIGVSLEGCVAYLPVLPCADCARALIQVGIRGVVIENPKGLDPRWTESCQYGLRMLWEAGVLVTDAKGEIVSVDVNVPSVS